MRSAAPQKLRSGNALRKSAMKALMSAWPFRGACNEYCRSMSGAASSSTMSRLHALPQKSVNQRPTMALLSSSLDMVNSSLTVVETEKQDRLSLSEQYRGKQSTAPRFLAVLLENPPRNCGASRGVVKGDKTACVMRDFRSQKLNSKKRSVCIERL